MESTIEVVDDIFMSTDFKKDDLPDKRIGLLVRTFDIYTVDYTGRDSLKALYDCANKKEKDHKSCMVICYFHELFERGVLGKAFFKGACSSKRNSAIVTSSTSGKFLSDQHLSLIVTRELGYSFGADHDPEVNGACTPGRPLGNFLMSTSVDPSGKTRINSRRFSPCSLQDIHQNLQDKLDDFIKCLENESKPRCGNAIVEGEEECDCGDSGEFCSSIDPCCTPGCKLKSNAMCSPRKHMCCSTNCSSIKEGSKKICYRGDPECTTPSYCVGKSYKCPGSEDLSTGNPCHNNQRICFKGKCVRDICETKNLQPCICPENSSICQICCMLEEKCTYSSELDFGSHKPLLRLDGSPCHKYTGVCIKGQCVDAKKKKQKSHLWRDCVIIPYAHFCYYSNMFL